MIRRAMARGPQILFFLSLLALAAPRARAAASLSFDAETLNALLPALAPRDVLVPLGSADRTVRLQLDDLKVTGFEPQAAGTDGGRILTSLRLRAPQLNLDLPVQPRLAVSVAGAADESVLELRFEKLLVPLLPGTPGLDVSALVPPLRFPVNGAFDLPGPQGAVAVHGRVRAVSVGARWVRFDFDLQPDTGR